MPLDASEIRETFLRFFEKRGHRRVASASLLPEGDPTLLFTNAGMVPFKRVFLGEETRAYTRAATSQKCMRVSGKHNDLENVGRTPRHHTFFEMLGNFSFGDYFKREAIEYAWELRDAASFGIARERLVAHGVPRGRRGLRPLARGHRPARASGSMRLDEAENFWSMGDTGPCGPVLRDPRRLRQEPPLRESRLQSGLRAAAAGSRSGTWSSCSSTGTPPGSMTPLPKPSIDTGAGLERLSAVVQGVAVELRHRSRSAAILERAQEIVGRPARRRSREGRLAPRRGRSRARGDLPDRRRRAARERGARLRAAPHPAPRRAARRAARHRAAVPVRGRRRRDRRHVRRLSRSSASAAPTSSTGSSARRAASSRRSRRGSRCSRKSSPRRASAASGVSRARPCSASTTPSASRST